MVQYPRWQIYTVIAVLFLGFAFAAPNVLQRETAEAIPEWLPREQVNLGLDLQGGSYLLLEVGLDEVLDEHFENLVDSLRGDLRQAKIGYTGLGIAPQGARVNLRDPEQLDQAKDIIRASAADILIESDDTGQISIRFTDAELAQLKRNALAQSLEIIRRRIDETGTREPSVQRQGEDRIIIQLPGVKDPERIKELLGTTAKMTFRFVDEGVSPYQGTPPPGVEFLDSNETDPNGNPVRYAVKKRVMVSGENLMTAYSSFQYGEPVVAFGFDAVGAKRFGDATQKNVGRLFAIVLDDVVISAPQIRSPILDGNGIITGSFTVQETQDLALLMRAGALPAPVTFLEERTVGAGLGADSIRAGKIASMLGLVFVIIFMALAYGRFGIMADIALGLNLILLLAGLSFLQATLTLPGIAGIVLTIGMAVDANVLIFERIREEARAGRSPVPAIDAGYKRAMTTIIDSNLTTLIAALLLFFFGTGPVKGFAVTLSIGLVTSMFTAIMVTRLMVVTWLRRNKPAELPI
jgi:preprotein translocase subunit SecD